MPISPTLKRLYELFANIEDRSSFDAAGKKTARKLSDLLRKADDLSYPESGFGPTVMASYGISPGRLSTADILGQLAMLYGVIENRIPAAIRKRAGLSVAVLHGDSDNRSVHASATRFDLGSKLLRVSADEDQRRAAQSLWLIGSAMHLLAPPRIMGFSRECAYCHRHVTRGLICERHRDAEGRIRSSSWQKRLFDQSMQQQLASFQARAARHGKMLTAIATKEEAGKLGLRDVDAVVRKLFEKQTLVAWTQAVDQLPSGAGLQDIGRAWYAHPEVADPNGEASLQQSRRQRAFRLLGDIARFEAYLNMGGEIARRRRKIITRDDQIMDIVRAYAAKQPLLKIASDFGISTPQVRRLLLKHSAAARRQIAARAARRAAKKTAAARVAKGEKAGSSRSRPSAGRTR